MGQWRLRRDNLQLRRQLAQAEAHHLKEVARLQHARDAAVKALCGKLEAAKGRELVGQFVARMRAKRATEALALSEVERSLIQQKLDLAQETEQLAVSRHKEADALLIFVLILMAGILVELDGVNPHLKTDMSKLFATPTSATQYNTYKAVVKTEFLPGLLDADDYPAAFKDAITRLIESDMLQPEA